MKKDDTVYHVVVKKEIEPIPVYQTSSHQKYHQHIDRLIKLKGLEGLQKLHPDEHQKDGPEEAQQLIDLKNDKGRGDQCQSQNVYQIYGGH
ncbi:MAG: hypothetical protein NTV25_09025 [Methanothrix sp.]|nr:hypothetical protein [Methanothrix sp.]